VGCLLYKQGNFVESLEMFTNAGDTLDCIYNRALCHYELGDNDEVIRLVN